MSIYLSVPHTAAARTDSDSDDPMTISEQPICTELFGLKSFGAIYCANGLAEGCGSYVFATLLFSTVYNRAIEESSGAHHSQTDSHGSYGSAGTALEGDSSGSGGGSHGSSAECYGKHCFIATALISAAACMGCAVLTLWLGCRSRPRYMALYPSYYPTQKGTKLGGRSINASYM